MSFYSRQYDFLKTLLCAGLLSVCACTDIDETKTVAADNDVSADTAALAGRVTVSGISSGGYMAVQAHIALSDRISGAAAIAAGPYHCAQGQLMQALGPCLRGNDLTTEPLLAFVREKSTSKEIADLRNLKDARVWVFHSPKDVVVSPLVGQALVEFYTALLAPENIIEIRSIESAHAWPTVSNGADCGQPDDNFINDCDYDAAGDLLQHLYGELDPPDDIELTPLREMDLSAITIGDGGISDAAFLYIPPACSKSTTGCRLHIVFHGCTQGAEFVGSNFVSQAGLNEWANANQIVVVYPQVEASLSNPQGCWDWWGYTGSHYDLNSGAQIRVVSGIIDAFENEAIISSEL